MSSITVWFFGICVNFQPPALVNDSRHRVVLPNASTGLDIRGKKIVPHFASLASQSAPLFEMPLPGCRLTIANASSGVCEYRPSYNCIPNLTQMAQQAGETLGPPDLAVTEGENPLIASAYFHFSQGVFHGCSSGEAPPNGAATTRVVVTTDGKPRLAIDPFPRAVQPDFQAREIEFEDDDATLFVLNQANVLVDPPATSPEHFLLNYLTVKTWPSDLPVSTSNTCTACNGQSTDLRFLVTAECSNSQYP